MDFKALLCYLNIYTLYLLHPIMASQRYCGTNLADALRIICADRGYYDQHHPMHGAFQAIIPRETASSFLSSNTENHPRRLRRRTGQIVTECCINRCTRAILETYCNPRMTLAPTRPSVTSISSSNPREVQPQDSPEEVPQDPRESYPMGDNIVRGDYEPPTNGGALTSGQPTPTENRISSGLREHSNTSFELITARTGNNSRVITEGVNLTDGSEQSSLEDENSESEGPTKSSERPRTRPSKSSRTGRPRPPRPPKKPRKSSKERKENRKDKKKKNNRDRGQRTNLKKQKNAERGSENPSPTRGGDREPTGSEQSRNRGKVNESQRPGGRDRNNEEQVKEIDKLKKKITFIREALRDAIIEPDSQIG